MTPELADLLERATAGLKIRNIRLYEASFARPSEPPPEQTEIAVNVFVKREVSHKIQIEETDGKKESICQAFVELGLRLAAAEEAHDGKEPSVYFQIEATFLADYAMIAELDEGCVKAFVEHNAVHNVWPFWRQHVYDVVQRGGLPHIDVPLFAGNKTGVTAKDPVSDSGT